ncbi:inositol monophosphatase family protein [Nakamurella sp. GG22]
MAEWDTAAGEAIVIAAGGVVRRVESDGRQTFLAGSATVVEELAALVTLSADQSIRDSPDSRQ